MKLVKGKKQDKKNCFMTPCKCLINKVTEVSQYPSVTRINVEKVEKSNQAVHELSSKR